MKTVQRVPPGHRAIVEEVFRVKKWIGWIGLFGLLTLTSPVLAGEESSPLPEVPAQGMVTMVDLGADQCIPCKMMAPIIKDLQKEYTGKAAIVFIDVWKHKEESKRFRIQTIPTQIFFDKEGKEISRHEGFLGKESILAVLKKAGVEINEKADAPDAGGK